MGKEGKRMIPANPYIIPGLAIKAEQVRRCKITKDSIIRACAEVYGLSVDSLFDKSRQGDITESRQIAMALIRRVLGYSLSRTGFIFRKDHATVIHSMNVCNDRMMYPDFREKYELILKKIGYND
jgi:chromosomal replication initiation ATPase DnaA